MHNYLIADFELCMIAENFNEFHKYISSDLEENYNQLDTFLDYFKNTISNLERLALVEEYKIDFIITIDILFIQINSIKQQHLLSYPNHHLEGVRETIQHLLHFVKKLDAFVKKHHNRNHFTFSFLDIEMLLNRLTTFYTEFDFTPNQLEYYHILNFDIFTKVFDNVCKGLEEDEITQINNKSLELYQVVYDVFYRHISNMYNTDTTNKFEELSKKIEAFVVKILKLDISNIVTNDYINDIGLDLSPFSENSFLNMSLDSLENIVEEEKKAEELKKIELSNNSTEINDTPVENTTELKESDVLYTPLVKAPKTHFLLFEELGIIEFLKSKYNLTDNETKVSNILAELINGNDIKADTLRRYLNASKNDSTFHSNASKQKIEDLLYKLRISK